MKISNIVFLLLISNLSNNIHAAAAHTGEVADKNKVYVEIISRLRPEQVKSFQMGSICNFNSDTPFRDLTTYLKSVVLDQFDAHKTAEVVTNRQRMDATTPLLEFIASHGGPGGSLTQLPITGYLTTDSNGDTTITTRWTARLGGIPVRTIVDSSVKTLLLNNAQKQSASESNQPTISQSAATMAAAAAATATTTAHAATRSAQTDSIAATPTTAIQSATTHGSSKPTSLSVQLQQHTTTSSSAGTTSSSSPASALENRSTE